MKTVRISDVCELIAGQSPPSNTYNDKGEGIPFFQGKADFGYLFPIVRSWCNAPQKIAFPNDILISVRAPVGPTNINTEKSCIGRGLSAIRCSEKIDTKFLLYYLRSSEDKIAEKANGSTFSAITQKDLQQIQIPLPPLDTQKKIAAILDAADTYRQKTKTLIDKYDQLAQSLFQDMFGYLTTNSKAWRELILGDVLELITYGLTVRPSYVELGVPLISAREIRTGKVDLESAPKISFEDFEKLTDKGKPKRNDILFSKTGSIGHCATVITDRLFAITQNAARLTFKETINTDFATHYLRSSFIQGLSQKRAKGNAVKDLQLGDMKKFKFLNPPISLQNQFAERIQLIEAQKQQAQASLQKAEDLFNSLLQRAFKGELVV